MTVLIQIATIKRDERSHSTAQYRKHVRDARDFNSIEKRTVIKCFFFMEGKVPKEIHAILTETLGCFLPGRAKDLSAPCTLFTRNEYAAMTWEIRGVSNRA